MRARHWPRGSILLLTPINPVEPRPYHRLYLTMHASFSGMADFDCASLLVPHVQRGAIPHLCSELGLAFSRQSSGALLSCCRSQDAFWVSVAQ